MHRKFITLIVASAIAITGLTAPARAGNDDFAKALAGLAALAIIGVTIHKNRNRDDVVTRRQTQAPAPHRGHRKAKRHHQQQAPVTHHNQVRPRPMPDHVARTILPRNCLRSFDTFNGGKTRMLGRHCLKNNYDFTRSLPQACAQRVWTARGERRGFNARCLKQNGYRMSRR